MKRPLCCWLHQQKVIGSWAPRDSLEEQKQLLLTAKSCFYLLQYSFCSVSHKRHGYNLQLYLTWGFIYFLSVRDFIQICPRANNVLVCSSKCDISLSASHMGWINSLVFKPSQNVQIKLEKLKMLSYFCSEMYVSCWYLLQTIKRNPKLQKLDRDCKLKLSLSLLLQLDQFFDQSRIDQLIKAVSEDKAHASGSNSARFCCYN